MIDTVVLTFSEGMFVIQDSEKFEPSAKGLLDRTYGLGSRGYMKCYQNPTPSELRNGIYKPRLTLTRRFKDGYFQLMLKVEFSIPKLIYGNNFDEINEEDYEKVLEILTNKLKDMGVSIWSKYLENAPVSSVHYSKNILLSDGLTPSLILSEIQKSNISEVLDFNQTDFRNFGHSVKYHANSYEIAFYDKIKDLQQSIKSEKRAIEKDNHLQMNLFEDFKKIQKNKPLEVLRMEIRLNQRAKIRQVLKQIGYETEPTLPNLFKKEVAQKVLFKFLDFIEDNYPKALVSNPKSNKEFISEFLVNNPKAKIKDVFFALGLRKALDEMTTREIKQILKKFGSSWYKVIKHSNSFSYTSSSFYAFNPIRDSLSKFLPLKLVDFEAGMLNNDKYQVI